VYIYKRHARCLLIAREYTRTKFTPYDLDIVVLQSLRVGDKGFVSKDGAGFSVLAYRYQTRTIQPITTKTNAISSLPVIIL